MVIYRCCFSTNIATFSALELLSKCLIFYLTLRTYHEPFFPLCMLGPAYSFTINTASILLETNSYLTSTNLSSSPAYRSLLLDVGLPPYRGGFAHSHHTGQAGWWPQLCFWTMLSSREALLPTSRTSRTCPITVFIFRSNCILDCRVNLSITPTAKGGVENSVRLLLTKNPACSFSCPSCQVRGISFVRFPRPWQTCSGVPRTVLNGTKSYPI